MRAGSWVGERIGCPATVGSSLVDSEPGAPLPATVGGGGQLRGYAMPVSQMLAIRFMLQNIIRWLDDAIAARGSVAE